VPRVVGVARMPGLGADDGTGFLRAPSRTRMQMAAGR